MLTLAMTGKLVIGGFCLGIGFWGSKKLTNLIDQKLLEYDNRRLKKLSEEMNLDHVDNKSESRLSAESV